MRGRFRPGYHPRVESYLIAFTGVAALMTISPGPDMALMLRNVLRAGQPVVVPTAFGIAAGLLVWAAGSSLGVAALVATSAEAYAVVRLVGAGYLAVLGLLALREAIRPRASAGGVGDHTGSGVVPRSSISARSAFRMGLLTNLTNPKVGVFYATLLPQFIPPGAPVLGTSLLLAAIHAVLGVAWLVTYGSALGRLGRLIAGGRIRRALEAVTGTVLVALGLRIATDA